jgi:hypothetical protein
MRAAEGEGLGHESSHKGRSWGGRRATPATGWPARPPQAIWVVGTTTPGHGVANAATDLGWEWPRGPPRGLDLWPRRPPRGLPAAPATPWPGSGWHRHPSPPHGQSAGTSESLVPPWINEVISSFVRLSPITSWPEQQ